MTDDRLEKVRAEVERLRQKVMGVRTDFADGQKGVLTELLSFIDSMQKEPKFKIGQTITDPEDKTFTFHINRIEDGKYIESDDAWVLIKDADEEYQLVEEPVSDELVEAAAECVDAEDYPYKDCDGKPLYTPDYLEYMFKQGARWQKERTIRKACEYLADNGYLYLEDFKMQMED